MLNASTRRLALVRSLDPRRPHRLLLAAVAALAASLALASLAQAHLTWPAPQDLSAAGQDAIQPQVAIDSQGRAAVVWSRSDGTNARIQAVRIGADGTPGAVSDLSAAGQDAFDAQVAIDSQDRATVVWRRSDGTNARIQAVRIGADGTPGAVSDLSAAGQDAFGPQVAIDSQDRATVVWQRSDGTNSRIQAVRIGADGTPGAVSDLSAAGQDAFDAQVAIDSQDRATVVWSRSDGTNVRIQSVRIGADGTPGTVSDLSAAGQDAFGPQVAIDSQDRATVVWQRSDGTNARIQAVRIGADGTPGTVSNLSAAGQDAGGDQVAIDSQGRATVVWSRSDGTNSRIQSVRIGADGTPGAVSDLSAAGGDAFTAQVAIDSQDRATVVWYRRSNFRIQAVRIGADGTPGTVSDLSAAGQPAGGDVFGPPELAIDSQDRPTAVWGRFDGTNARVQAVRGVITTNAPTFTSSSPVSPSNDTSPKILGSAEAGSTVNLYPTADCSGSPAATGSAAAFASPGLTVTVAGNSSTTFHATATDSEGDASACSSDSITYSTVTPTPDPTPDPTPPTPELEIIGLDRNRAKGTATLTVATNLGGALRVEKTNKVKRDGPVDLLEAGSAELRIVPRNRAAERLQRTGRLTVSPRVLFAPTVGGKIGERHKFDLRQD